ncbi:putative permease [Halospina denitrificans]|uniref:Putative permease n=1 Tax=Halospina denitrificans TaxID=332522 RepID=A0A4R7K0K5_9GAMM|nr:AI-2E family transporter [Halospina denitrificans]TDT42959.1 putative permease [Halospina denitrificans]
MVRMFHRFVARYFSDEEAVVVLLMLIGFFLGIFFLGRILAPFIAGLIIAYILQGLVIKLVRVGVPHLLAVFAVFILFIGIFIAFLLGLMPLVWSQVSGLASELPRMMRAAQHYIEGLPQEYPQLVSMEEVNTLFRQVTAEVGQITQWLVSMSLESIPGLMAVLVYLVLVPILVFFFLKDRDVILLRLSSFLPDERPLMDRIWAEVNMEFANFVRGKAIEILIVGSVTYVSLKFLGLDYAALLSLLVGFSVVIPYIGAAVVTVPIAMVGLFQFGWTDQFFLLMVVYLIIQAIDGNILVPLLFSEVVDLHPVTIILAVLIFGGIWGMWGVFFAIPLAIVLNAVLKSWPVTEPVSDESPGSVD